MGWIKVDRSMIARCKERVAFWRDRGMEPGEMHKKISRCKEGDRIYLPENGDEDVS